MFAISSLLYSSSTLNLSATLSPSYGPPTSPSLTNLTYAKTLLNHGEALYSFAMNASGGMGEYSVNVKGAGSAYASSGYGDDLVSARQSGMLDMR